MVTLRSFNFEHLPRELRDKVYYELLVGDNRFGYEDVGLCMPFDEDPPDGCNPAILATSKNIHEEAALILYGQNRFHYDVFGISRQIFLGCDYSGKSLPKKYINLINYLSVSINFKGSETDYLGDVPAFEIVQSNVKQMADMLADNHHIAVFKLQFFNGYFNAGLARKMPNSFRGNWAMGEQVLAPLAILRGVTKVVLDGHAEVSKYARELKRLMELPCKCSALCSAG